MDSSRPEIAVVNYGMGNLRSVTKALEAVGAHIRLVETPDEIGTAAGLVLPGVGALGDCVDALEKSGLADTIRAWIREDRPFLGVCLGLQALFEHSEEGDARGLGVFPGRVVRFRSDDLKVPHMGWNNVAFKTPAAPLVSGVTVLTKLLLLCFGEFPVVLSLVEAEFYSCSPN